MVRTTVPWCIRVLLRFTLAAAAPAPAPVVVVVVGTVLRINALRMRALLLAVLWHVRTAPPQLVIKEITMISCTYWFVFLFCFVFGGRFVSSFRLNR